MIKPCICNSLVHRDCLEKWRKSSFLFSNNLRDVRCEICHFIYEYEDPILITKYNNTLICIEVISIMLIIQGFGLALGNIMTGFGSFHQLIITSIPLTLYQYILGSLVLHLLLSIIIYLTRYRYDSRSTDIVYNPCCHVMIVMSEDSCSDNAICCFLVVAIAIFTGFFIVIIAVYVELVDKSRQKQRIQQDSRIIRDLLQI
jgi:hypothetical protein